MSQSKTVIVCFFSFQSLLWHHLICSVLNFTLLFDTSFTLIVYFNYYILELTSPLLYFLWWCSLLIVLPQKNPICQNVKTNSAFSPYFIIWKIFTLPDIISSRTLKTGCQTGLTVMFASTAITKHHQTWWDISGLVFNDKQCRVTPSAWYCTAALWTVAWRMVEEKKSFLLYVSEKGWYRGLTS